MQLILLIYLLGVIFNIFFSLAYWYQNRRVVDVNYQGAILFVLLSWLIYPMILLNVSLGR